jgi:hypothetical protein
MTLGRTEAQPCSAINPIAARSPSIMWVLFFDVFPSQILEQLKSNGSVVHRSR